MPATCQELLAIYHPPPPNYGNGSPQTLWASTILIFRNKLKGNQRVKKPLLALIKPSALYWAFWLELQLHSFYYFYFSNLPHSNFFFFLSSAFSCFFLFKSFFLFENSLTLPAKTDFWQYCCEPVTRKEVESSTLNALTLTHFCQILKQMIKPHAMSFSFLRVWFFFFLQQSCR